MPEIICQNGHRLIKAEGKWWRCIGCREGFRSDLTGQPDVPISDRGQIKPRPRCPAPPQDTATPDGREPAVGWGRV